MSRALAVEGLVNARDLGGLPLIAGGTTPRGVFFRSENVDRVTRAGWAQLYDAGIRAVVDLRHAEETVLDTNVRPDWLHSVSVDLDNLENPSFWTYFSENDLGGSAVYYLPHLAAMPERTGAALTALALAPPGGVLFHCMAGRDRTGLVAMVLLTIAGVEPEAIVADYLETLRVDVEYEAVVASVLERFGTSTEQAFRDALAGLDVDTLLAAAGLPASVRSQLESWRGHPDLATRR